MANVIHGVEVHLEMWLPATEGFRLDINHLDQEPGLAGPGGWQDVLCEVTSFDIDRGDFQVDQRPNCALETGTLTVELVNVGTMWLPDDLCELLGQPNTGLHPGTRIQFWTYTDKKETIFTGKVVDYVGDWIGGAQVVTLTAVDNVADIAAVNPTAEPVPIGWAYRERHVADLILTPLTPCPVWLNGSYFVWPTPSTSIEFRDDRYAAPLKTMWQKWADTSLVHLGMRGEGTLTLRPMGTAKAVDYYLVDCALNPTGAEIPMHMANLRVDAAAIINDCMASADRATQYRWRYEGSGMSIYDTGFYSFWKVDFSPTSHGFAMDLNRYDQAGVDRWPEFSQVNNVWEEIAVRIGGVGGMETAEYRLSAIGGPPTLASGEIIHFGGLLPPDPEKVPDAPRQVPITTITTVGRVNTSVIPADATAVHAFDPGSIGYYGLQDYRRLDLPFRSDEVAPVWAAQVVALSATKSTYLDTVEVHLHQPGTAKATSIDLLDRVVCRKRFPEYGGQVLEFEGEVVGISDQVDPQVWIRRFTISPIDVRKVA